MRSILKLELDLNMKTPTTEPTTTPKVQVTSFNSTAAHTFSIKLATPYSRKSRSMIYIPEFASTDFPELVLLTKRIAHICGNRPKEHIAYKGLDATAEATAILRAQPNVACALLAIMLPLYIDWKAERDDYCLLDEADKKLFRAASKAKGETRGTFESELLFWRLDPDAKGATAVVLALAREHHAAQAQQRRDQQRIAQRNRIEARRAVEAIKITVEIPDAPMPDDAMSRSDSPDADRMPSPDQVIISKF